MNEQTIHDLLAGIEAVVENTPVKELPTVIGSLATLQARAQLKMMAGHESANGGPDDLLTIPEVAKRLKVSDYRAYELARQGEFKTIKLGKSVRVTPAAIADYLAKQGD